MEMSDGFFQHSIYWLKIHTIKLEITFGIELYSITFWAVSVDYMEKT